MPRSIRIQSAGVCYLGEVILQDDADRRFSRIRAPALAVALGLVALLGGVAHAGTWTPLVNAPPGAVNVMVLLTDGTVMVQAGSSTGWCRLKPDSHGGYVNGTWTTLSSMHDTRQFYALQVLKDGRVFAAGGEYGTGSRAAEVYDPMTNTWTQTPTAGQNFMDSISELLGDGRVLVAPVVPTVGNGTVIYDPATSTWSAGPTALRGQDEVPWLKLPDGSILCVDGNSQSERFIPSLNQWVADAATPVNLFGSGETGCGHMLANGKAFFRGYTHTALYTPSGSSAPGTWITGPTVPGGQNCGDTPGAVMTNGNVLFAAGPGFLTGPASFFEYDAATNTIAQISGPTGMTYNNVPYDMKMLCLPDGSVLVNAGSALYEYLPSGAPVTAFAPSVTSVAHNADGSYHLTGTNLNGFSEGAAYGDDYQMSSNYPLVRLTDGSGTVYYARTFGWSSTAVQTGVSTQTTEFTLPLNLPAGTYSLAVVAGGIASSAVAFTTPATAGDAAPRLVALAEAAPDTVVGKTALISVLASDSDGNGEAGLTYTWTLTSAPPGVPTPSLSVNGSNAAKNTTATFQQAGSFTYALTITDTSGLSVSDSVSVTVVPTLSDVAVTPSVASLSAGQTQQLSALAVDQFGTPMPTQPDFTWALLSGGGSVSSSGLYTAPASGGTLATVSATSGALSGTAAMTVVATPWTSVDVGAPALAGAAYNLGSGSTFTVTGAGIDIWEAADQFHYVYRSLDGDGTIMARVFAQPNTATQAKAGVMIRESTDANAAHAMMLLTPGGSSSFLYRPVTNANSASSSTGGHGAPYWVKLVRSGSTITGYSSSNGVEWDLQSSAAVAMTGTSALVGLAVSSANPGTPGVVTFDFVSVMAAQNDTLAVNPGAAGTLNVLANDTGPGGASLSISGFTPGAKGVVTNAGGGLLRYTPQGGAAGTDVFTYTVSDGTGNTASARVTVFINGLQAWYKFDEGSGTSSIDMTGDGYDCSLDGATWTTGVAGSGALSLAGASTSTASLPALNLNTNMLTMSGWVKRSGTQTAGTGIVFCRASTTASGLTFGSGNQLGYNWNDTAATYSFNSGLTVPDAQWTVVALVVSPTSATLYMQPLGGSMQSATNVTAHAADAFDGVTTLGQDTGGSTRCYSGALDEVQIYNVSLNATQIAALAVAGPGVATAAAAAPGTVTGSSTALSALGSSIIVEESALSYTWAATAMPAGAGAPAFSANGTNAAKNTTTTFTHAGSYTLTVTIADSGGGSVTSSVPVTVTQLLTSVVVSAGTPVIGSQITQQFTATALDQFGNALAIQPSSFTWKATGYGSVSSSGLYTAPYASGLANVSASSGGVSSGSAGVTASTPWKAWVASVFTDTQAQDPSVSGPSASPARDGVSNLLKYALNASPTTPASAASLLPVFAINGNTISYTYRQNLAATDLSYVIEQSPDLTTWTPVTPSTTVLSDDGSTRVIRATLNRGSTTNLMLRLRVVTP